MSKCKWAEALLAVAGVVSALSLASGESVERIYFSALDKEEKPVLGLTASSFELSIDGKPALLSNFHPGLPAGDRSVPLVAWILIDFNPNVKANVIQQQAGAAAAAFKELNPASAIGVKLVSDLSVTLAPLAHDPPALGNAFVQFGQRRTELNVGIAGESARVGQGGIARALELAMDEIDQYVSSTPSFRDREVHRAAMIISDANLNTAFDLKTLYHQAARQNVFLYPVFFPRAPYGFWVKDYFEMAKKTAGVASVFGALKPGAEVLPLPKSNLGPNALDVNFFHMIRDLNGKYSFTMTPVPAKQKTRIALKCKVKGVQIRLPRAILP